MEVASKEPAEELTNSENEEQPRTPAKNAAESQSRSPAKLPSHSPTHTLPMAHRAKAFLLDTDSNDWLELATGTCATDPSEDRTVFSIRLRSEEDSSLVLFTATFHKGQSISIQNDTVLTWTTHEGDEAALSFEDIEGCNEFWRLICRFQERPDGYMPPTIHTDDSESEGPISASKDNGGFDSWRTSKEALFSELESTAPDTVEISFPEQPEFGNLAEIEESLHQALNVPPLKRRVAQVLLEYQYIPALLAIFQECEEYGRIEELGRLFRVFKYFFLLNNQELLKVLMSSDNFLLVAGVFEYDPALNDAATSSSTSKPDFRSFLQDPSHFRQAIPIKNEEVLSLIHQTFRLQYFKDVVLARILDEESGASFILCIRLNHMAIINALDNDPEVMETIQRLLSSENMASADQLQLLRFFKEFLNVAKTVSLRKSLQIYQGSLLLDFLQFLNLVLHKQKPAADKVEAPETPSPACELLSLRLLAVELLINFIQHDAVAVRAFIMQHPEGSSLLGRVIDLFLDVACESSVRWQILTALRVLLDTFNPTLAALSASGINLNSPMASFMAAGAGGAGLNHALSQKSSEDFLNFFYPEYACRLLKPVIDLDKTVFSKVAPDSYWLVSPFSEPQAEILFHLGELLCSFIGQHKYRIKYLILRNLILQNMQMLLRSREKALQLTSLRVFRSTLGTGDEFYYRFFIQHRSFAPIIALYKQTGGAGVDNLVTSAILELFEHVRTSRPANQDLIRHLATFHKSDVELLGPESVFKGLLELADRMERGLSIVDFDESDADRSIIGGSLANPADDVQMQSPRSDSKGKLLSRFESLESRALVSDERAEEDYFSGLDDYDDPRDTENDDEDDEHYYSTEALGGHDSTGLSDEADWPNFTRSESGDEQDSDDAEFPFLLASPTPKDPAKTSENVNSPTKKMKL